ncbi:hypothetical protein E4U60_006389 [Claviceps pazoutovae]|uniref:Uncharacterized protein n=1 Tax=Claviceps pazoutovae TaxID=1649127 RepID=A0A9P7M704_9HYPO|nr:hypothetical protein E4U60_006389 [Claviceps pazoutovae]
MVQIKSLMVAMVVAIAPVAQAWNCTPGRRYCGWNLSRFNYDETEITKALQRSGLPLEKKDKTLFTCNPDGSVRVFYRTCTNKCHDSGPGKNDVCVL